MTVAKGFPGADFTDIFVAFRKTGTPESAKLMEYYLSQEQWRELRKNILLLDLELEKLLGLDQEPSKVATAPPAPSVMQSKIHSPVAQPKHAEFAATPKKEAKPKLIPITEFNAKIKVIRHRNLVLERMAALIRRHSESILENYEKDKLTSQQSEVPENVRQDSLTRMKQRVFEIMVEKGF